MNLWISSQLLVVGLFLSTSALSPEECQLLVTPLSLADRSMLYGRWNFIVGYTDSDAFNAILKVTESSWMNVNASSSPDEDVVSQEEKLNGTCLAASVNVAYDDNIATTSISNITSKFHVLPSIDGCMIMNINTTARDLDKLLHVLNIEGEVTGDEINLRALYLMCRVSTLTDSEMEYFKKQASCLGFSREPDFLYDHKNGYCAEGEGIKMKFD
ncbi:uncharacterized protein LOC117263354 isoform X3 [Epinephelus lanceolatus]|uniref:uncharacterized protein LOC117263488 n=1 Tax=Epinephelus lanceolatus TaxID=310571 RepID=UPI001448A2A8|nr:uncharacterized protein LOC117263488 [Epinephelus lanceolatus]